MNKKNPPLIALKAFEVVARKNSFKEAAEELSITPSALSQHVKNLEDYFGFPLFVTRKPSIQTTVRGAVLKKGLEDAFKIIRTTVDAITEVENEPKLNISAESPLAHKWLSNYIADFSLENPTIETSIASSLEMDDYVRDNIDIGICFGRTPPDSMHSEEIGGESLVVVASPEFVDRYGINSPNDLLKVPLLHESSLSFCDNAANWQTWFRDASLVESNQYKGIYFGEHAQHAIESAINGGGALLTRYTLVKKDLETRRLIIPFGPVIPTNYTYKLICPYEKLNNPSVKSFIDWVKGSFRRIQIDRHHLFNTVSI